MPVPFCPFGTFGTGSVLYHWSEGGLEVILENEYTVKLSEIGKGNKVTNKAILSYLEDIGGIHSNKTGNGIFDISKTKRHAYSEPRVAAKAFFKILLK